MFFIQSFWLTSEFSRGYWSILIISSISDNPGKTMSFTTRSLLMKPCKAITGNMAWWSGRDQFQQRSRIFSLGYIVLLSVSWFLRTVIRCHVYKYRFAPVSVNLLIQLISISKSIPSYYLYLFPAQPSLICNLQNTHDDECNSVYVLNWWLSSGFQLLPREIHPTFWLTSLWTQRKMTL